MPWVSDRGDVPAWVLLALVAVGVMAAAWGVVGELVTETVSRIAT